MTAIEWAGTRRRTRDLAFTPIGYLIVAWTRMVDRAVYENRTNFQRSDIWAQARVTYGTLSIPLQAGLTTSIGPELISAESYQRWSISHRFAS